ncbi:hypothetical protein HYO65_gp175 [Tenacibaculum phage PTm1]|uniref:Uncharacterized protein n=2 Tax=Shirahamavirus PTm1 TaxID=2846435 RepID=A0A5S9BZ48_9CAUD|nr:hypothetical protein HYO65_gp175 [Tenacibaculum phage PTm1]BBI90567.1 hypothetical protein [Tenacibaculum phage PTm1]BBI90875.1 hypothetical protein [Tenacibaculum phage PTm5]
MKLKDYKYRLASKIKSYYGVNPMWTLKHFKESEKMFTHIQSYGNPHIPTSRYKKTTEMYHKLRTGELKLPKLVDDEVADFMSFHAWNKETLKSYENRIYDYDKRTCVQTAKKLLSGLYPHRPLIYFSKLPSMFVEHAQGCFNVDTDVTNHQYYTREYNRNRFIIEPPTEELKKLREDRLNFIKFLDKTNEYINTTCLRHVFEKIGQNLVGCPYIFDTKAGRTNRGDIYFINVNGTIFFSVERYQ